MPINVFGNSNSNNSDNKIDTSLFVQKPYLKTKYIEANIEENIDLKNQFRIKNVPDPISIREVCSKNYVDNLFNDPSIIKNTAHVDFNDKNLDNVRFVKVNSMTAIGEHLTAKYYVDNAISNSVDESSLLRLDANEKLELDKQDSIILNSTLTDPMAIIEIPAKAYIDSLHEENVRSRRDLGIDFYEESSDLVKNNQDNNFNDNKLTNLDSVTINRNPNSDNELANKKYVDDQLDKNTIVRFNQTLENHLKVSVGNDTYNLTKYNKIQLTDITVIKAGNTGGYLLPNWKILCNDINNNGNINRFIKSTKTSSPTSQSGATSLPPIGNAFMYIKTSSGNSGNDNIFVSWERTDIIQITNITFYYNRFSILTNDSLRSMGRFIIQLLSKDNTWDTQYTIAKNTQYSNTSTDWTLLNLDFTVENYGIKLIYDKIYTAHSDMCFSNITITHSVY